MHAWRICATVEAITVSLSSEGSITGLEQAETQVNLPWCSGYCGPLCVSLGPCLYRPAADGSQLHPALGTALCRSNCLSQGCTPCEGVEHGQWFADVEIEKLSNLASMWDNSEGSSNSRAPCWLGWGFCWNCVAAWLLPLPSPAFFTSEGVCPASTPQCAICLQLPISELNQRPRDAKEDSSICVNFGSDALISNEEAWEAFGKLGRASAVVTVVLLFLMTPRHSESGTCKVPQLVTVSYSSHPQTCYRGLTFPSCWSGVCSGWLRAGAFCTLRCLAQRSQPMASNCGLIWGAQRRWWSLSTRNWKVKKSLNPVRMVWQLLSFLEKPWE